jgi:hypothetical protein
MAAGDNPILPLFDDGDDLTAAATAAITAGRFVKVSATLQGGPLLDVSSPTSPLTKGNLIQVAQCVAGDKALGVAKWDAPNADDVVGLFTGNQVVPMIAGATVTAGNEVQSDAAGKPIPLASGKANGIAISDAGSGVTVYIKLYS